MPLKVKRGQKKLDKSHKFETLELCYRRINRILMDKRLPKETTVNLTNKIMRKLQNSSKSCNSVDFKDNFIRIAYQISNNIPRI
jgi:hypothetical protein